MVPQPAGWQLLLHAAHHGADVTALALAAAPRLLAVGDAAGHASVIDLSQVVTCFDLHVCAYEYSHPFASFVSGLLMTAVINTVPHDSSHEHSIR